MTEKRVASIVEKFNKIYLEREEYVDSIEREQQKKLAEFQSQEKVIRGKYDLLENNVRYLEGFKLKMASRISPIPTSTEKSEIDIAKLTHLDASIRLMKNDPCAIQCYNEACMQLNTAESEKESLNRALAQIRKEKESFLQDSKEAELPVQEWIDQQLLLISSEFFQAYCQDYVEEKSVYTEYDVEDYSLREVGIGTAGVRMMLFPEVRRSATLAAKECYLGSSGSLQYNVGWDMVDEPVLYVEHFLDYEDDMFGGLRNILIHIAHYHSDVFQQVVFIDPIRFSAKMLGCLSELSDVKNSWIDKVPSSTSEIKKKIGGVLEEIQRETTRKSRLLILYDFPKSYDEESIKIIQQLCANATFYNIKLILLSNIEARGNVSGQAIQLIKQDARVIHCSNRGFSVMEKATQKEVPFRWYLAAKELTAEIKGKLINSKETADFTSFYEKRVDISSLPNYSKGNRRLAGIPYGIDQEGSVLELDFLNENFGSFISGASRSGKSTLLHSIITGIFKNNHPDDVELWLVDFKMTEFSRYIENTPPHIRYIILDESPEVVYDLVDRLSEILEKRQSIFKREGWEKLSDVPKNKYMPAIFVIIDEFSVMSQILADSVMQAKDNYMMKLQTLLAKGAALGFHFIFASQGFTSGTRGLNDFSKKQIQQRISLKTEVAEIQATLDLTSDSEEDKRRMRQIPPYHTLVRRIEPDIYGNWLIYAEILHFEEKTNQLNYIKKLTRSMNSVLRFDANDVSSYIDKRKLVIDGNSYQTYEEKRTEIEALIDKRREENEEFLHLALGTPKRMLPVLTMALMDAYNENVMLVASSLEMVPAVSTMITMAKSAKYQGANVEVWSNSRNALLKQYKNNYDRINAYSDLDEIVRKVNYLKDRIEQRRNGNNLCFLVGFDMLLNEYEAEGMNKGTPSKSQDTIERRKSGGDDLWTMMQKGVKPVQHSSTDYDKVLGSEEKQPKGNLKEDLNYILKYGPKYGYHFVMVFESVSEISLCKIDGHLFSHKVFFRAPKNDLNFYMDSLNSNVVSNLASHIFRYTNGIESVSYKPYFHAGLTWDSLQIDENGTVTSVMEEDEYLM